MRSEVKDGLMIFDFMENQLDLDCIDDSSDEYDDKSENDDCERLLIILFNESHDYFDG